MEKQHPHIEALRVMTESMPDHNPYYMDSDLVMHLETVYGKAESVGIYSDENISIARTVFYPNTQLLEHSHSQREVIMVLEGSIEIVFVDNLRSIRLNQHNVLEVNPNEPHFSRNTERAVIMVCLMPYSPYFPKPNGE